MMKLAVGVPSLEAFESRIEARRLSGTGMQVWTRSFPKRADDVIGNGSLYWVVAGLLSARQPIITIEEDTYDDGSRCARIELEPTLIRISPLRMRPFQGWRYLDPAAAPADVRQVSATGIETLPPEVLRELRELCLV
jgi:hypothetical protein